MRRAIHPLCLLMSLLLVCVLAACSNEHSNAMLPATGHSVDIGQQRQIQPLVQPPASALTSPGQLAQQLSAVPRAASYTAADLIRAGDQFEAALPHQNAVATAGAAALAGTFGQTGSPGASGLAFAIYRFTIPGYEGNAQLTYDFSAAPATLSDAYFGFANWGKDRWDWFEADASGNAEPASLAPYFLPDGTLLVVALLSGSNNASLANLRIGSQAPVVQFKANPRLGLAPLTVNFDATGTVDPDGTIAQYRWDPDGDGVFDISTGTVPTLQHEYTESGKFTAGLRVFDDQGIAVDSTLTINTTNSAIFSFGRNFNDEGANAVVVCDNGDLLLLGSSHSSASEEDEVVSRIAGEGSALFSKSYDQDQDDIPIDAALGSDGFVYVAGFIGEEGDYDGLLQKWSQDGELIFSRRIGESSISEVFVAISVSGDGIYVSGQQNPVGNTKRTALVARFDLNGSPVWHTTVPAPDSSDFNDVAIVPPNQVIDGAVVACGDFDTSTTATQLDALYAEFDFNGNRLSCRSLGDDAHNEAARCLAVTGGLIPDKYVCGSLGTGREGFMTRFAFNGGSVAIAASGNDSVSPRSIALVNGLPTVGFSFFDDVAEQSRFLAASFNASLVQTGSLFCGSAGSSNAQLSKLINFGGGSFVMSGSLSDTLPSAGTKSLDVTAAPVSWADINPASGQSTEWTNSQLSLQTADYINCSFNRQQSDGDCLIVLGQTN